MPELRPFPALRPVSESVASLAAPPYDVVDVAEARFLASGKPDCFLHVSRPEIDLPDGVDPSGDAVHARGAAALADLVERGRLIRDETPTLSVYRLRRPAGPTTTQIDQTGVAGLATIADYRAGRIAIHENTRPDKENDRTAHMAALAAHDEPVLLMYPTRNEIDTLVSKIIERQPSVELTDRDEVRHTLWIVDDPLETAAFTAAFADLARLYVADGHHRSAAAARLAERADRPGGETDAFPVVAFAAEQLTVLPYHRVVAGPLPDDFPASLEEHFKITDSGERVPEDLGRHEFGMYTDGLWHRLITRPDTIDDTDPVSRLDVAVLQDFILGPLLKVTTPRTDPRIAFVGGAKGTDELVRLVDSGRYSVAFALHPTSPAEVMEVADADRVMPPKSTWFEPKLASGLFLHALD